MTLVTKKELLELLDQGAIIEFGSWGLRPDIYVRLEKGPEKIFKRVHQSSFLAVRDAKLIVAFKREGLWTYYRKRLQ